MPISLMPSHAPKLDVLTVPMALSEVYLSLPAIRSYTTYETDTVIDPSRLYRYCLVTQEPRLDDPSGVLLDDPRHGYRYADGRHYVWHVCTVHNTLIVWRS